MKKQILPIMALCTCMSLPYSGFANEYIDNGTGTRVDWFDKEGKWLYSVFPGNKYLSFQTKDGKIVPAKTDLPDTEVASAKFVNWGTESYPVTLKEDGGQVKEAWIEYENETRSAGTKVKIGEERTVKTGTKFTLYVRVPSNQYPLVSFHEELTGWSAGEKRTYQISYFKKFPTSAGTYIQNLKVSNAANREFLLNYLPGHQTSWKQSETDPELWYMNYTVPNEPLTITVGTESADDEYLDTCLEAAMRIVYSQCSRMNWQFQYADVSISNWIGDVLSGNFISWYSLRQSKDYMSLLNSATAYYTIAPWVICMTEIDASNFLLDNLNLFNAATTSGLENARGQLLSLRSYAYLRLLQLYAPRWADSNNGEALSAPLKTSFALDDPGLSSMKDIISQCYSDLDEAAKLLDGKSRPNQSFFSSDVAKGLKIRIALLSEDWDTARSLSKEILQNNNISSEAEVRNGFFAPIDSWLWGVSNTDLSGNQRLYYYSFQNHNACNGNYIVSYGYGSNAIDRDLYDRIPDTDVRRTLFVFPEEDIMFNSTYINPSILTSKSNTSAWCVPDYIPEGVTWPAFTRSGGRCKNIQVGSQIKFWHPGPDISESEAWFPMMRTEEILLSLAEAAYRSGDESEAVAALEKLNANRSQGYTCTKTGEDLMDEIRFYRDVELWGEGFAWFDYKRWNLPIKRNHWVEGDKTSGNWPSIFAASVTQDEFNGWRVVIPAEAVKYNPLIDINQLGYTDVSGYEEVLAANEKEPKLTVKRLGVNNSTAPDTEPQDQEE